MLATRMTEDNRKILSDVRRDRVARERPAQLAERARLIAELGPPDPAAAKQEAAYAAEIVQAERAVNAAHMALNKALDRVSELRRNRHGRSYGALVVDQDARAKLRASCHPAVGHVENALRAAFFAALAVRPTVTGVEISETTATAEEGRGPWWKPSTRTLRQPLSTHLTQTAFITAISDARARVEDLTYQDLDDDDAVAKLRAELDQLVALRLPLALDHVQRDLIALRRRKLDRPALELWAIDDEGTTA